MKSNGIIALVALIAFIGLFAEEIKIIDYPIVPNPAEGTDIPSLLGLDFVGGGRFVNQPSPSNPVAEVYVDDCWRGNVTNDIIEITFEKFKEYTDWIIPTNVPVMFFAASHTSYIKYYTGFVYLTHNFPPDEVSEMFENAKTNKTLYFPCGDRAWFRTTRDNGLVYDFTTNIWESVYPVFDRTNHYERLRVVRNNNTFEESERVWRDVNTALNVEYNSFPTNTLLNIWHDPSSYEWEKNKTFSQLYNFRGWKLDRTNNMWVAP